VNRTVCVSACSSAGVDCEKPAHRPMGAVLLDVVDFVRMSEPRLFKRGFTLSPMMQGNGVYKHFFAGLFLERGAMKLMMPSPEMQAVAARLVQSWLGRQCGHDKTFAAIVRIAEGADAHYGGQSAEKYADKCLSVLRVANRKALEALLPEGSSSEATSVRKPKRKWLSFTNSLWSPQPRTSEAACSNPRAFMASDWFADADIATATAEGLRQARRINSECWAQTMRNESAPAWLWPSDTRPLDSLVAAAAPSLLRPWGETSIVSPFDAAVHFRAFLDLTVLASVDRCFAKNHMIAIIDRFRQGLGRPGCERD